MTMTKHSDAYDLANKVATRYGKFALARAAGEAAAAERKGDHQNHDLWASVVSYLRYSIQQSAMQSA